jgi:hypothetical protein
LIGADTNDRNGSAEDQESSTVYVSAQSRRPSLPDTTYHTVAAENASRHLDVYVLSFRHSGARHFPHRVSDHLVAPTVR